MTFWHLVFIYALAVIGAVAIGLARLKNVTAGAHYPALHLSKYVLGAFLATTIVLLMLLLSNAASCTKGERAADGALIIQGCNMTRNWYAVMTDWQSGIGAFVGLLGLAWSTLLKAIMEKSQVIEGN